MRSIWSFQQKDNWWRRRSKNCSLFPATSLGRTLALTTSHGSRVPPRLPTPPSISPQGGYAVRETGGYVEGYGCSPRVSEDGSPRDAEMVHKSHAVG